MRDGNISDELFTQIVDYVKTYVHPEDTLLSEPPGAIAEILGTVFEAINLYRPLVITDDGTTYQMKPLSLIDKKGSPDFNRWKDIISMHPDYGWRSTSKLMSYVIRSDDRKEINPVIPVWFDSFVQYCVQNIDQASRGTPDP